VFARSNRSNGLYAASGSGVAAVFTSAGPADIRLISRSVAPASCSPGMMVFAQGALQVCIDNKYRRVVVQ
jgi:hypothetical protein